MSGLEADFLAMLRCPACRSDLTETLDPHRLTCTGCGRRYAVNDGIPALAPDLALEEE